MKSVRFLPYLTTVEMVDLNRRLLSHAKRYAANGNKAKALSYLCEHGCSLETANKIVEGFSIAEHYLDGYILEKTMALLPENTRQATELLAGYYEISTSFAELVVEDLSGKTHVSPGELGKMLEILHPSARSDKNTAPSPALPKDKKIFWMVSEGKYKDAIGYLAETFKYSAEDAKAYLAEQEKLLQR